MKVIYIRELLNQPELQSLGFNFIPIFWKLGDIYIPTHKN